MYRNTDISYKKMHFKMLSAECWPFYLGLNMLKPIPVADIIVYPPEPYGANVMNKLSWKSWFMWAFWQ